MPQDDDIIKFEDYVKAKEPRSTENVPTKGGMTTAQTYGPLIPPLAATAAGTAAKFIPYGGPFLSPFAAAAGGYAGKVGENYWEGRPLTEGAGREALIQGGLGAVGASGPLAGAAASKIPFVGRAAARLAPEAAKVIPPAFRAIKAGADIGYRQSLQQTTPEAQKAPQGSDGLQSAWEVFKSVMSPYVSFGSSQTPKPAPKPVAPRQQQSVQKPPLGSVVEPPIEGSPWNPETYKTPILSSDEVQPPGVPLQIPMLYKVGMLSGVRDPYAPDKPTEPVDVQNAITNLRTYPTDTQLSSGATMMIPSAKTYVSPKEKRSYKEDIENLRTEPGVQMLTGPERPELTEQDRREAIIKSMDYLPDIAAMFAYRYPEEASFPAAALIGAGSKIAGNLVKQHYGEDVDWSEGVKDAMLEQGGMEALSVVPRLQGAQKLRAELERVPGVPKLETKLERLNRLGKQEMSDKPTDYGFLNLGNAFRAFIHGPLGVPEMQHRDQIQQMILDDFYMRNLDKAPKEWKRKHLGRTE